MKQKNVFLRALELSDAMFVYELENDASIRVFGNSLLPISSYVVEQFVKNHINEDFYSAKELRLAICLESSQELIGFIDLFDFEPRHRRAKIGIVIKKENRGNGYALEALSLMEQYAFDVLDLFQLCATIRSDNQNSKNLFLKAGYQHTASLKYWFLQGKKKYDELIFQKIRT